MDAKTRDPALLAALSLFCAGVALISDHLVLGLVFFVFGESLLSRWPWTNAANMGHAPRLPVCPASGAGTNYDVLCEGAVVGRIMKAAASPVGRTMAVMQTIPIDVVIL